jgi:DNA repair exonuclease SbcCD nuclease subunit
VRIVGVPYRAGRTLGRDLAGFETDPLRTVLLAHGTLHTSGLDSAAEDEGQELAYYPIVERDLRGRFAYAALGHVHARASFDRWSPDAAWGYAGSPIAITRGELGRRHAVVVDFLPGRGVRELRRIPLDTPHWVECAETLLPWDDVPGLLDRIARRLDEAGRPTDPNRGVRIRIDGYLDGDEAALRDRVEDLARSVESRFRRVEVDVSQAITVRAMVEQHPWLADLLGRLRRRAARDGIPEPVVRRAAGLLVAAGREGPR